MDQKSNGGFSLISSSPLSPPGIFVLVGVNPINYEEFILCLLIKGDNSHNAKKRNKVLIFISFIRNRILLSASSTSG